MNELSMQGLIQDILLEGEHKLFIECAEADV